MDKVIEERLALRYTVGYVIFLRQNSERNQVWFDTAPTSVAVRCCVNAFCPPTEADHPPLTVFLLPITSTINRQSWQPLPCTLGIPCYGVLLQVQGGESSLLVWGKYDDVDIRFDIRFSLHCKTELSVAPKRTSVGILITP